MATCTFPRGETTNYQCLQHPSVYNQYQDEYTYRVQAPKSVFAAFSVPGRADRGYRVIHSCSKNHQQTHNANEVVMI